MSPINTVLIANRGEIAVRAARTLRRMGIRSIAIYTHDDPHHSSFTDLKCLLDGTSLSETYLNIEKIVRIAKDAGHGVDAVIPGYGFLSEDPVFATAVEEAGLVWIGPTPEQMRELGFKDNARRLAMKLGIPIPSGSECIPGKNVEDAIALARTFGWPVMLKHFSGGGGKGTALCENEQDFRNAFARLNQESECEGGLFIEQCIPHARHIEVQILGNGKGDVFAIGDRDCSAQRRQQKIFEECPAPFVPESTREAMKSAALRMAASVSYRGVGTAEFLLEANSGGWFFLEFNVRLQVEHGVTEAVFEVDLVECMVNIARNIELFDVARVPRGVAFEARMYAESPVQDFRPSTGKLLQADFSSAKDVRVDTWISPRVEVTASYDPLLAKVIAWGESREEAACKLDAALSTIRIIGVETNIHYLRHVLRIPTATITTRGLENIPYTSPIIEVLEPGGATSVQDGYARVGWGEGIPPSGPMDSLSFRCANMLVGNDLRAAALECTERGPVLRFHCARTVILMGGRVEALVDGEPAPMAEAFLVEAGKTLAIGMVKSGRRVYLAVSGGINVPWVLGSRSTFPLGKLGGLNGRMLKPGDLLWLFYSDSQKVKNLTKAQSLASMAISPPYVNIPESNPVAPTVWRVGAMAGPHSTPEFITPPSLQELFSANWAVHYNSSRLGVRLTGPSPKWARATGGNAGLHPSNIHDSPYAIGSISFTGDAAVVLTCDGPSLGGFVVFAVILQSEMWKIGQARPGDIVQLVVVSEAQSSVPSEMSQRVHSADRIRIDGNLMLRTTIIGQSPDSLLCRPAGGCAVLLEFGTEDGFDIRQTMRIAELMEAHRKRPIPHVVDLVAGVRTLLVRHDTTHSRFVIRNLEKCLESITAASQLSPNFPSRVVELPLAFDDMRSRAAVDRYAATIRREAPYLPSNVDFLNTLNFADSIDTQESSVEDVLLRSEFLVLGLGDVFLGSPLAVPLDPRHRLLGTKYSPTRTSTPRGSVGIGGQYLCVYAAEGGPGGYQLVARTVGNIWDEAKAWSGSLSMPEDVARLHSSAEEEGGAQAPWMFRILDRIRFYPVDEAVLDDAERNGTEADLVKIEDGTFDVAAYEMWLAENCKESLRIERERKEHAERLGFDKALSESVGSIGNEVNSALRNTESEAGDTEPADGVRVKAGMPGRCLKYLVSVGDTVAVGDVLVSSNLGLKPVQ